MSKGTVLLAKSKKSALVMAAICCVTAFITQAAWNMVAGIPLVPRSTLSGLPADAPHTALLAGIGLVILATAALAYYLIYWVIGRLDATHYGLRGAAGWATVGCLSMLAYRAIDLLMPAHTFWRNIPFGIALLAIYLLVFRVSSYKR